MKTNVLLTIVIILVFNFGVFAQGITNDGAVIVISSGTTVSVTDGGGYLNLTNGSNHGQIDLDGTLQITGDFVNEATDAAENVFINTNTDGTVVFTGTADQHISNLTANAFIDFENLTVNKTSNTVFVDAGSAATVNGDLLITAGTFRLSSPADGEDPSGSLITVGNVSGAGALYVDRHFETNGRWVYFSVPVSNGSDNDFDNTNLSNNFNPNLYSYSENYDAPGTPANTNYTNWTDPTFAFSTAWFQNQIAADGSDVALEAGKGYITYNETEIDVEFGGGTDKLNNLASYSPTLTFTQNDGNSDYYDGWNVIGNPYQSALDWDDSHWIKTNISSTVYMWDGDGGASGNYVYYNKDDGTETLGVGQSVNELSGVDANYIPAMQTFVVKATGSNPSITIPIEVRKHHKVNMYKNTDDKNIEFEYLKLKTEYNDFSDETLIRFLDNATLAVDDQYDAYKMFPYNPLVMIYSISTMPIEIPVAINSLPKNSIGSTIPLVFFSFDAGTFTIQVSEFNFDAGTEVKLIDVLENTETTLYEGAEYTFNFAGDESRDRFYLFSKSTVGIDDEPNTDDLHTTTNVWSNANNVFISISSYDLIDAEVQIFDLLGKTVIHKKLNGTYNVVNVPGSSGTYFVKLRTKDGQVRTDKVFIVK